MCGYAKSPKVIILWAFEVLEIYGCRKNGKLFVKIFFHSCIWFRNTIKNFCMHFQWPSYKLRRFLRGWIHSSSGSTISRSLQSCHPPKPYFYSPRIFLPQGARPPGSLQYIRRAAALSSTLCFIQHTLAYILDNTMRGWLEICENSSVVRPSSHFGCKRSKKAHRTVGCAFRVLYYKLNLTQAHIFSSCCGT